MLKKFGIPQESLNKWSQRIDEGMCPLREFGVEVTTVEIELTTEKFRSCLRWRYTWGRRWATATGNAPERGVGESPPPDAAQDRTQETGPTRIPAVTPRGFKFMEICDNKEEAAAVMAIREAKFRDLPIPMVVRIRTPHA
jgi:hypothetical protein